ncbi:hypothetical protein PAQ31011_01412 [Pandoraea aquatica]|uniref:Uncharacterized protein n=1 Tax=Pandoraea aquatica TaxID=2508290 RepID=A0A5E4TH19_9BURK|nr:hypothetical protein PAQ31011_01412 [Pandoraea aquatica]
MTVVASATGSQQAKMLARAAHFDKSAQPALSPPPVPLRSGICRAVSPRAPSRAPAAD